MYRSILFFLWSISRLQSLALVPCFPLYSAPDKYRDAGYNRPLALYFNFFKEYRYYYQFSFFATFFLLESTLTWG